MLTSLKASYRMNFERYFKKKGILRNYEVYRYILQQNYFDSCIGHFRRFLNRAFCYVKIIKDASNRKWTCGRLETALHDTVVHTDALRQISGSWLMWFLRKCDRKFCDADTDDTSDPYMSPPLTQAVDTKM